jgi:hypothetical protein
LADDWLTDSSPAHLGLRWRFHTTLAPNFELVIVEEHVLRVTPAAAGGAAIIGSGRRI